MSHMKADRTAQPHLPIPSSMDWCTVRGAAARLAVSDMTVRRYIRDGKIKAYLPYGAPDENPPQLLYCDDVDKLAAARKRVRGEIPSSAPTRG